MYSDSFGFKNEIYEKFDVEHLQGARAGEETAARLTSLLLVTRWQDLGTMWIRRILLPLTASAGHHCLLNSSQVWSVEKKEWEKEREGNFSKTCWLAWEMLGRRRRTCCLYCIILPPSCSRRRKKRRRGYRKDGPSKAAMPPPPDSLCRGAREQEGLDASWRLRPPGLLSVSLTPCRYRPKPPPFLCSALPYHLDPAPDGLHLLPPHSHKVPASSEPARPSERPRLFGLWPVQPTARTGKELPGLCLPLSVLAHYWGPSVLCPAQNATQKVQGKTMFLLNDHRVDVSLAIPLTSYMFCVPWGLEHCSVIFLKCDFVKFVSPQNTGSVGCFSEAYSRHVHQKNMSKASVPWRD